MLTSASVQLKLDRILLARLAKHGYLTPDDRDPTTIRNAVICALTDCLAPNLASPARHGFGY